MSSEKQNHVANLTSNPFFTADEEDEPERPVNENYNPNFDFDQEKITNVANTGTVKTKR